MMISRMLSFRHVIFGLLHLWYQSSSSLGCPKDSGHIVFLLRVNFIELLFRGIGNIFLIGYVTILCEV